MATAAGRRVVTLALTLEQISYVHALVASAAEDIAANGNASPFAGFLADDEATFTDDGSVTEAAAAAIGASLAAFVRALDSNR